MVSCENISYMLLNLVGEVGEFSSKVAKAVRSGKVTIGGNTFPNILVSTRELSDEEYKTLDAELCKEAGDILWQLSGLCKVMGWDLETVAKMNLRKLASRQKRGVIDGEGDNR